MDKEKLICDQVDASSRWNLEEIICSKLGIYIVIMDLWICS
jgi:hypothetical protein